MELGAMWMPHLTPVTPRETLKAAAAGQESRLRKGLVTTATHVHQELISDLRLPLQSPASTLLYSHYFSRS